MPQANLTDMQTAVFTIPHGDDGADHPVVVTHNLQDQNGAHLTPDRVYVEIVEQNAANMAGAMAPFVIMRSTPEDGTVTVIPNSNENAAGVDWVFTIRIISEWIHSIQSRDHTP